MLTNIGVAWALTGSEHASNIQDTQVDTSALCHSSVTQRRAQESHDTITHLIEHQAVMQLYKGIARPTEASIP